MYRKYPPYYFDFNEFFIINKYEIIEYWRYPTKIILMPIVYIPGVKDTHFYGYVGEISTGCLQTHNDEDKKNQLIKPITVPEEYDVKNEEDISGTSINNRVGRAR
jgi:hypothetical protein